MRQPIRALHRFWVKRIHFLELHYLYILSIIFIFSGLYYCQPGTNWNYIDALFMATTGSTDTGLNTIPMSDMTTYHMVILYLSSFLGSHVTVSFVVVMVRRYYFSKRFEELLEYNKLRKEEYKRQRQQRDDERSIIEPIRRRMSFLSTRSTPVHPSQPFAFFKKRKSSVDTQATRTKDEHFNAIEMEDKTKDTAPDMHPCDAQAECRHSNGSSSSSHDNHQVSDSPTPLETDSNINNNNTQQITFSEDTNVLRERERRKFELSRVDDLNPIHRTNSEYEIMRQPTAKSELTKMERNRIGGTEYRALEMLAKLVPIYYLGFIISFGFFFRIYIGGSTYAQEVLKTSNPTGPVNPWFFSFFMSLSSFTNLGLNHLDASMTPFQNSPAPLILAMFLILAGNTAFAILLRCIIWCCYQLTPKKKIMRRETFRYLLDHPRRCFTTLFPATQTWWLLIVLVAITAVELICFLALNYWLPVLADLGWGARFLDGLFQSVATRNGTYKTNCKKCEITKAVVYYYSWL